jgi:hypothetical protein
MRYARSRLTNISALYDTRATLFYKKIWTLWTLPLGSPNTRQRSTKPLPISADATAHFASTQTTLFTHTVRNKANSIQFAHQSLCSPQISTLLKVIRCGYLKGCPNLMANGVTKYLSPSPATTKGHMKRPHQGIHSTRCSIAPTSLNIEPVPLAPALHDLDTSQGSHPSRPPTANFIEPDGDTAVNVFCFSAFADKRTGILYSDLTGTFPFMSLEGNVCFLGAYHYETNAILALPIKNFTDKCILSAYKKQFELLKSKGHKIRLNVMDNQASRVIKEYLTLQPCENLLVKLNNHKLNAAKRAIQTFKAHFISALAMTDSKCPLQLWDCLTPQVKNTLNMLRPSRLDPTMSAYEALRGPYDWNRFPLAPPGCKAVIYADHGQAMVPTHGVLAHPWTTINAIICLSPRQEHIEYLGLQNYFHNIASSLSSCGMNTCRR